MYHLYYACILLLLVLLLLYSANKDGQKISRKYLYWLNTDTFALCNNTIEYLYTFSTEYLN